MGLWEELPNNSISEEYMAEKEAKGKREKVPRQKMPEQKPEERVRNFDEVPFGYTPELARLEAGRCLQCKKPKCIDGCPSRCR